MVCSYRLRFDSDPKGSIAASAAYIIGKNCLQFFTVEPEPLLLLCRTGRAHDIHLVGLRRSLVRVLENTQSSTGGVVITYSSGRGEDVMHCKYVRHITEAIANEPVEDGYTHPAEKLLEKALNEYGNAMVVWIQSFIRDYENRAMAAALFKCVARLPYTKIRTWAIPLAERALQDRNVQVRDAAVCALEMWGDSNSLKALSVHKEKEPWLRDYIERLITELS